MPRITTIAEASELVGRTFERDGRRFRVDRIVIHFSDDDSRAKYVSRYADGINEFNDWLSGATEVTDG